MKILHFKVIYTFIKNTTLSVVFLCYIYSVILAHKTLLSTRKEDSRVLCLLNKQMRKIQIKKGDRYGKLVIISELKTINYCRKISCQCYCGKEFIINLANLKRGQKSCGCLTTKRHGMSLNKIYFTWKNLRQRCLNPNQTGYKNYGGRGVKFCKRWQKFENFYEDMKEGYSDNLSLDRINNNKGYSKENCRWANRKIQSRNKRCNVKYKKECATDASKRLGGNKQLVLKRIYDGWSIKKAFTTPVSKK